MRRHRPTSSYLLGRVLALAIVGAGLALGHVTDLRAQEVDRTAVLRMWQRVQKMSPEQRQSQWDQLPAPTRATVQARLKMAPGRKPGRPIEDKIRKIPAFTAKYR